MRHLLFFLFLTLTLMPSSAQAVTVGACSGYTPAVRAGIQARISPGASNRLRQSPNLNGVRIGEIPSGGVLSVLYGPTCADNITWWLVRYQSQIGWTAEGEGNTHWIVPVTAENHAPKQPPDSLGGTSTSVLYSVGICASVFDGDVMNSFAGGTENSMSGDSVVFRLGEDSLRVEPGVCAPQGIEGEVRVYSPFGFELAADIAPFDGIGTFRATLPDIAYTIPGVWILSLRDYVLYIDIQEPQEPFMQGLYSEGGTYSLILGGFQPNERLVIVTSRSTADAVSYTPDIGEMLETYDPALNASKFILKPEVLFEVQNMIYLEPETSFGIAAPTSPEITILPEFAGVLDGTVIALDTFAVTEVSNLVFDQLDGSAAGIVEGLGMADDSGSTGGIFGLTFQDFSGTEIQADANGFVYATIMLDGRPLAAIGQTGNLAIWPNLANLYVPGAGDPEALRQTLYNAYWADEETAPTVPCTYTVASGDTLNRIARTYGISLEQLLAANPQITNPDVIFRGLVLNIPGCD